MEALELAKGLRVVGAGVDRLDPELAEATLELHLDPVQASREAQPVVRQHLPRQAVARGGEAEAVPCGLGGRPRARQGSEQVAGVVIDHVHHPGLVP